MRLLAASLLIAFALAGCSKKDPGPEPQQVRAITQPASDEQRKESTDDFLKAKDLQLIKTVAAIPQPCMHAFAHNDLDRDAELDEPPASGDHSQWDGKATPSTRRLIFAGANARTCFVYFRKGSSVATYHLQIFHLGPPATIGYDGMDAEHIYPDLPFLRRAFQKKAFETGIPPAK